MYVTAYNTTDAPITVDAEGRQIGGRDWGTADTTGVAKDDFTAGSLVKVEVSSTDAGHPDAIAAAQRTEQVNERADQLQDIDKDVLAAAAAEAEVPRADEMSKPELVAALAARDVPIPDATQPAADEQDEQSTDVAGEPADRKTRRR